MQLSELALLRLVAQRLAGPPADDPAAVVTHLGAVQAQDLPGALESVALRCTGGDPGAVVAALNQAQVVRSWPMRGTLHLVAAADLGWMLSLTVARTISSSAKRRREVGITDSVLDQARDIALQALDADSALPRKQLFALWGEAGLLVHSQTGVHLLSRLCQEASLVLGPMTGREQLVVAYATWIPHPRRLDRDEALAELARRFVRSHGPVQVADVARWTSLSLTESRAALAAIRPEVASTTIDGGEYFFDPALPDLFASHRAQAAGRFLLPGFDEFILGYADRSFTVPPAFAQRIVPGNNGMFRPTIVEGGQVVGTWKRGGTKARPDPEIELFEPQPS